MNPSISMQSQEKEVVTCVSTCVRVANDTCRFAPIISARRSSHKWRCDVLRASLPSLLITTHNDSTDSRDKKMIGNSRQRSAIFAATLVGIISAGVVDASSWQDPSSSAASRPDPPGYSGRPPPPKRPDENHGKPPESSSTAYNPIHYQFPSRQEEEDSRRRRPTAVGRDLSDGVPLTELDRESLTNPRDLENDDENRPFASPRTDLITRFISTKKGRGLLTLSSGAVGAAFGSFLGKVRHSPRVNYIVLAIVSRSFSLSCHYNSLHIAVTHESCFPAQPRVCRIIRLVYRAP